MEAARRGGGNPTKLEELEEARDAAVAKTNVERQRRRAEEAFEAECLAEAAAGPLDPGEILAEADALALWATDFAADARRRGLLDVYIGIAKLSRVDDEIDEAIARLLVKGPDGAPLSRADFSESWTTSRSKVAVMLAEALAQHAHAKAFGTGNLLYARRAAGGVYHVAGLSCIYVLARKPRPGDDERTPSTFIVGDKPISAARRALIAAATSPAAMPAAAPGDVDRALEKGAGGAPYWVFTRGCWVVRRWSWTPTSPYHEELVRLWPSAERARKDAAAVVRFRTTRGYIEVESPPPPPPLGGRKRAASPSPEAEPRAAPRPRVAPKSKPAPRAKKAPKRPAAAPARAGVAKRSRKIAAAPAARPKRAASKGAGKTRKKACSR